MFAVEWMDYATGELARLWMTASSPIRASITGAVHQIDQRLASGGDTEGESRGGRERITFESPLGVKFHVEGKSVVVHHVWLYKGRK